MCGGDGGRLQCVVVSMAFVDDFSFGYLRLEANSPLHACVQWLQVGASHAVVRIYGLGVIPRLSACVWVVT